MTEQVDAGVPEHAVEAQHHLQTGGGGCDNYSCATVKVQIGSQILHAAREEQSLQSFLILRVQIPPPAGDAALAAV